MADADLSVLDGARLLYLGGYLLMPGFTARDLTKLFQKAKRGGVGSEHPEELVRLFEGVGKDFKGSLPDFANFPDEPTRERGLKLLFPYVRVICHAKELEFDAEGNETKFNFPRCVEISKQAGFKGIYSIEFEGLGDPHVGVQKTLDELLRYL